MFFYQWERGPIGTIVLALMKTRFTIETGRHCGWKAVRYRKERSPKRRETCTQLDGIFGFGNLPSNYGGLGAWKCDRGNGGVR